MYGIKWLNYSFHYTKLVFCNSFTGFLSLRIRTKTPVGHTVLHPLKENVKIIGCNIIHVPYYPTEEEGKGSPEAGLPWPGSLILRGPGGGVITWGKTSGVGSIGGDSTSGARA